MAIVIALAVRAGAFACLVTVARLVAIAMCRLATVARLASITTCTLALFTRSAIAIRVACAPAIVLTGPLARTIAGCIASVGARAMT